MNEYKTMTYEETLEELEFAMEHNIDFTKRNIDRLLSKDDVERIVRRLGIVAKYKVWIIEDDRAYCVLSFNDTKGEQLYGRYFGEDVINQYDSYVIDGTICEEADIN
jgi:hypothetical protein